MTHPTSALPFRRSVDDLAPAIRGAVALTAQDGRLHPRRIRDIDRPIIPTAFMKLMADTTAGVRIAFDTDATCLSIALLARPIDFGFVPAAPAILELLVDGALTASHRVEGPSVLLDAFADTVHYLEGEPTTVTFAELPPGDKSLEVWLPHNAVVEIVEVAADRPLHPSPAAAGPTWVHHGSSISHCLEADTPTHTWPAVAARRLGFELIDLAYAGNAMLDPFVARTIRDTPADLITLKLGINLVNADSMTLRTFTPAVRGFLDTIREGHPNTPIMLISPISCPLLESRPGPTGADDSGRVITFATEPYRADALTLTRIRGELERVVAERAADDPALHYLDGRVLFADADAEAGLLPDGLHPETTGYRLMGERFAAHLEGRWRPITAEADA